MQTELQQVEAVQKAWFSVANGRSLDDKESALAWLRTAIGREAEKEAKAYLDALARERRAMSGNLGRYVNEDAPTQEVNN